MFFFGCVASSTRERERKNILSTEWQYTGKHRSVLISQSATFDISSTHNFEWSNDRATVFFLFGLIHSIDRHPAYCCCAYVCRVVWTLCDARFARNALLSFFVMLMSINSIWILQMTSHTWWILRTHKKRAAFRRVHSIRLFVRMYSVHISHWGVSMTLMHWHLHHLIPHKWK